MKRITNLSDSAGYFAYAVDSDGRKTMTEDSHIPCFTLSEIRNSHWCWPSQVGAEYPLVRSDLSENNWRAHILACAQRGGAISEHIVIDALWRSTPSMIWCYIFQNVVLKHVKPAPDRFETGRTSNPLTRHPGLVYSVFGAFRAGASPLFWSNRYDMDQGELADSSLRVTPVGAEPETQVLPSARQLLCELLLVRSPQTALDDIECQRRIGRLCEIVKEEDTEDLRRYNAHIREESEASTLGSLINDEQPEPDLSV